MQNSFNFLLPLGYYVHFKSAVHGDLCLLFLSFLFSYSFDKGGGAVL